MREDINGNLAFPVGETGADPPMSPLREGVAYAGVWE